MSDFFHPEEDECLSNSFQQEALQDNLSEELSQPERPLRKNETASLEDSYVSSNPESEEEQNQYAVEEPVSESFQVLVQEGELSIEASEERITLPILTKYEKAKILGIRASQISGNSAIFVQLSNDDFKTMNSLDIAQRQLQEKKIPFKLRRFMPNGTFEQWSLEEFES